MVENKLFEALLDVIPFGAYAVDINTYEVVYANKLMRENMFAPQGKKCWEAMYGQDEACSWCSVKTLIEKKSLKMQQDEKYIKDFFYEHDDRWLKSYSEIIHWPDGRDVKYSILIDITDEKALYGDMIQAHAKMAIVNKHITTTNKNLQITKLKFQKSSNELEFLKDEIIIATNMMMDLMVKIENTNLSSEQLEYIYTLKNASNKLSNIVKKNSTEN